MISYEEALRLVQAGASASTRRSAVPLPGALGQVSAEDITARIPVPGFDNAAMDGYAVRAIGSAEHAVRLGVAGCIAAGQPAPPPLDPAARDHLAWEIFTGAPVPADMDAVIPLERVTRIDGTTEGQAVILQEPARPGQNIRRRGEDFQVGQVVVRAGTRLAPHHLMGLAAAGIDQVRIVPPPRVAVLTTGNELAGTGMQLGPGQICDANGPYLQALLRVLGCELAGLTTAADGAAALRTQLERICASADVVLTTGGVSAGRLDLLPPVIRALGAEQIFHQVAIRPGKPLLHARFPGGPLLFGLPGNPLAVAVGMRFFVVPALRTLQGLGPEAAVRAVTPDAIRGRGTLRFFAKAAVTTDAAGTRQVRLLPGQESFRIAPLLRANCWAIVPENVAEIPAGGTVQTLPLYPDDAGTT